MNSTASGIPYICIILSQIWLGPFNSNVLPRTTFSNTGTGDEEQLVEVFQQCDAVAHCAGINREIKPGDYDCAHVLGTRNVVNAAQRAGVKKLALISFYRARPNCGSLYHESKFASEEIVRGSELDYTVIKAGMIYGKGDHMLDHLSHVFHTVPVFALVGMKDRTVAPLSIEDLVKIAEASLVEGRMSRQTVAAVGPEKMSLGQMIRRVGNVVGKTPLTFPFPVAFHENFAKLLEATMKVPLIFFCAGAHSY